MNKVKMYILPFELRHIPNAAVRIITRDRCYVCEDCHRIHKRDGQELRLDNPEFWQLMSHPIWYGSVAEDCAAKTIQKARDILRQSCLKE